MMQITLGSQRYTLRPTFAALLQVEEETGLGLITLARKIAAGDFTMNEAVAIIRAGLIGAGKTPPADLGALVFAAGVAQIIMPLAQFLEAALTGADTMGKA